MRWKITTLVLIATLVGVLWGTFVYPRLIPPILHAQSPSSSETSLAKGVGVVVPSFVNFQGYLRDSTTGESVSNGNYSMRYCLYGSPTGGSAVWCETHSSIAISNGIFSVQLGTTSRIHSRILARPSLYLGVKVGNDSELTPRSRLGSSFYSVSSQDSATAVKAAVSAKQLALSNWYPINLTAGAQIDLQGFNTGADSGWYTLGLGVDIISSLGYNGEQIVFASTGVIGRIDTPDGFLRTSNSSVGLGSCIDLVWIGGDHICIRNSDLVMAWDVTTLNNSCESCKRGVFDGSHVWVTQSTGSILKFSVDRTTNFSLVSEYSVGSGPHGIAYDGDKLWVTDSVLNQITTVNPDDGTVLSSYPVGTRPTEVIYDGEHVWVLNTGADSISKVDASDGEIIGTYSTGNEPINLRSDGSVIWVVHKGDGTAWRIRARDGEKLSEISIGNAGDEFRIQFDSVNMWISSGLTITKY
ncbi:hypothetical protein M1O55_04220 [Dehalococcoidia bacterium]|nr:hypothetical protein [Dehalococcoidia bacterium]